jgi:hypothetical protein
MFYMFSFLHTLKKYKLTQFFVAFFLFFLNLLDQSAYVEWALKSTEVIGKKGGVLSND